MTESVTALLDNLINTREALTADMLGIMTCIAHPSHDDLARLDQELLSQQLQIMSAYRLVLASRIKLYQMDNKA
jgi:hypothetical protein